MGIFVLSLLGLYSSLIQAQDWHSPKAGVKARKMASTPVVRLESKHYHWIDQLSSPVFQEREEAYAKLSKIAASDSTLSKLMRKAMVNRYEKESQEGGDVHRRVVLGQLLKEFPGVNVSWKQFYNEVKSQYLRDKKISQVSKDQRDLLKKIQERFTKDDVKVIKQFINDFDEAQRIKNQLAHAQKLQELSRDFHMRVTWRAFGSLKLNAMNLSSLPPMGVLNLQFRGKNFLVTLNPRTGELSVDSAKATTSKLDSKLYPAEINLAPNAQYGKFKFPNRKQVDARKFNWFPSYSGVSTSLVEPSQPPRLRVSYQPQGWSPVYSELSSVVASILQNETGAREQDILQALRE